MPEGLDRDWMEWTGTNVLGGFIFGTVNGFYSAYFKLLPPLSGRAAYEKPFSATLAANIVANKSMEFAMMGGIYSLGTIFGLVLRTKDDLVNNFIGGAALGSYLGAKKGGLDGVVVWGVTLGVVATFNAHMNHSYQRAVLNKDDPTRYFTNHLLADYHKAIDNKH